MLMVYTSSQLDLNSTPFIGSMDSRPRDLFHVVLRFVAAISRTFLGAEVKVKFSDGQRGVFGYYLCVVPGRIEGF